jgi:hypothetical protein
LDNVHKDSCSYIIRYGEPAVGEAQDKTLASKLPIKIVWLCGGKTADITPMQPMRFSMAEAQELIKKQRLKVRMKSQMATIFDFGKLEISLFDGGRMLLKNVTDEQSTLQSYKQILQMLNISFQ